MTTKEHSACMKVLCFFALSDPSPFLAKNTIKVSPNLGKRCMWCGLSLLSKWKDNFIALHQFYAAGNLKMKSLTKRTESNEHNTCCCDPTGLEILCLNFCTKWICSVNWILERTSILSFVLTMCTSHLDMTMCQSHSRKEQSASSSSQMFVPVTLLSQNIGIIVVNSLSREKLIDDWCPKQMC